mmetsp:Transcript_1517/g.2697  ORF Transcript_1517/g.2697 Transcript_1517/m.2697 type:complete len:1127 (+) Transcript_1517:24-3404(+)
MERNGVVTQSLPSLQAGTSFHGRFGDTRNSFWQRAPAGSPRKQATSVHLSNQLSSSSSTPALPRIADALKQDGVPKGSLWRESAAVLQANAGKLPFLNQIQSIHPHSDRSLVDTQELMRLQRDARLTRESNASALRLAYETRGNVPRGMGATLRVGDKLRSGDLKPSDVTQRVVGPAMVGETGSFGSGAGGKRQKRVTKLRENIRVVHRKENMQAALAKDQQFVQQNLKRAVETPHTRQTREQQFDDHWWEAVFAPIPDPLRYLPVAFKGVSPLAAMRLTGQRWRTNTPKTPAAAPPPRDPTAPAAVLVLTYEECQEVIRVCSLFQALTEKPDNSPPVLSRPAFCRMVYAMSGLSSKPQAPVRLCRAMVHFDRMAEKVHVRGCSYPGGTMMGLSLQSPPNLSSGFQQELTIHKLFTVLLKDMMPHGNGDAEVGWQLAKMRLFDDLFPQAEKYAKDRAAFVHRQMQGSGPTKPQIMQATPIEEEIKVEIIKDDKQKKVRLGSKSTNQSRGGSLSPSPREPPPRKSPVPAAVNPAPAALQAEQNGSDSEAEEEVDGTMLYAHTFAVLKGELLMCQLLEPEVLHVLLEFKNLFYELFKAYADIPLSDPASDGHMSLTGFLRFCDDFGLFPTKVDFQTAQWLYNNAESCIQARSASITSAPVPVDAAETSDGEKPAPKVKGGKRKKPRAKEKEAAKEQAEAPAAPAMVLWSGKWLKGHLAWLTKDFGEMSEQELRCARLLEPLNDWMTFRHLLSRDVFSSQLREGGNVVGLEVFQATVDFMHLEDPPSREELAELLTYINPDGKEEVDFNTLDMALIVTQKKKEKLERATNAFLKEYKDMSQTEYSACLFFKELLFLLEKNRWTPEELFRKMDRDGSGALDNEEVTRQLKSFAKMQSPLPAGTRAENPFDILDLNSDSKITMEEFVSVFQQVEIAKEIQSKQREEGTHPIFVSSNSPTADYVPPGSKRTFGHKAFVECMMKVALVHLDYHATATQAEQSSLFKVLWLVMFLHWNFERAAMKKEEAEIAKAAVEQKRSPKAEGQMVPTMLLVSGPKHVTPMQRLLEERPRLFSDMQMKPIASSLRQSNGFDKSAWGCVADDLLNECLATSEQPQAHGPQSFDRLLFDMVTS